MIESELRFITFRVTLLASFIKNGQLHLYIQSTFGTVFEGNLKRNAVRSIMKITCTASRNQLEPKLNLIVLWGREFGAKTNLVVEQIGEIVNGPAVRETAQSGFHRGTLFNVDGWEQRGGRKGGFQGESSH